MVMRSTHYISIRTEYQGHQHNRLVRLVEGAMGYDCTWACAAKIADDYRKRLLAHSLTVHECYVHLAWPSNHHVDVVDNIIKHATSSGGSQEKLDAMLSSADALDTETKP